MDNHMPPHLGAILADHDRGPEYALVECVGDDFTCKATERVENSACLTDAEITALLAERGWTVGPTHCPSHASASPAVPCPETGCGKPMRRKTDADGVYFTCTSCLIDWDESDLKVPNG